MKSISKGRPIENTIPILKYTQTFKEYDGTIYTWEWDKEINPKGPLYVTINDPQYNACDKLLKEISNLEKKYIHIEGIRKTRITKIDKLKIEQLNAELDEQYYSFFPEERPVIKIRKNAKIKNPKI